MSCKHGVDRHIGHDILRTLTAHGRNTLERLHSAISKGKNPIMATNTKKYVSTLPYITPPPKPNHVHLHQNSIHQTTPILHQTPPPHPPPFPLTVPLPLHIPHPPLTLTRTPKTKTTTTTTLSPSHTHPPTHHNRAPTIPIPTRNLRNPPLPHRLPHTFRHVHRLARLPARRNPRSPRRRRC